VPEARVASVRLDEVDSDILESLAAFRGASQSDVIRYSFVVEAVRCGCLSPELRMLAARRFGALAGLFIDPGKSKPR